jgi:hypothetical protein
MPRGKPHGHSTWTVFLSPGSAANIRRKDELNTEVKEALGHCPQCGSGYFTQYRADENPENAAAS